MGDRITDISMGITVEYQNIINDPKLDINMGILIIKAVTVDNILPQVLSMKIRTTK